MRRCASQDVRVSNGHDDDKDKDKDSHRQRARSLTHARSLALAPAGLACNTLPLPHQRTDDALAALGVKSLGRAERQAP